MSEWLLPEKSLRGLMHLVKDYKWIFAGSAISLFIVVLASTSRYFLLGFFANEVLESQYGYRFLN